jgi:hypothetical protein
MSKHYLLFAFLMLGFGSSINAQITITSASFPVVGDTLRYALDLNPTGDPNNYITPPGGNQIWNFTNLKLQQTSTIVYRNPNTGTQASNFPGAELLVIGNNNESYYNVTTNRIELLGYNGGDPANLGINVLAKYAPPIVERRAPLQFFDINQQTTNLSLPFSKTALPDSLVARIPGAQLIDSVRIRLNFQRLEVADGWGTLQIPGRATPTPVLREKRTEYTTTAIDVRTALGWINIPTSSLGEAFNSLGTDTTVSYRFYSNTDKEELAVVTLNNAGSAPEMIRFKNFRVTTATSYLNTPDLVTVRAFPNPATDKIYINFNNAQSAQYQFKIYNLLGIEVLGKTYQIPGKQFETELDISRLNAGTYFYSLLNNQGIPLITKQLIIIKL